MLRSTPGHRLFAYPAAFLIPAVFFAVLLRPWSYPVDFFFPGGHDWVWQQAAVQMHGQVGVWGVTDHVAWPIGANPWRLPQMGALVGLFAWFTVGVLGIGSASAVLWALCLAAALNSVAVLYFLRAYSGPGTQILAVTASVATGASTFVVASQLNLAFLYAVPLAFAVIARWSAYSPRGRYIALAVAALGFAMSPMWWIVVLVLLLPLVVFTWLLRGDWQGSVPAITVLLATLVGFVFQLVLYVAAAAAGPGADATRDRWGANTLGGRMVDLVAAIPLVERLFPELHARLVEGAAMRMNFSIAGLLLAVVALLALFALPARRWQSGRDVTFLLAATLMTVLYWLAGGLGNAQAALAAVLDSSSPARAFARMPIVLGFLGAAWLIVLIAERKARQGLGVGRGTLALVVAVVLAVSWLADTADLELRRASDPPPVIGAVSKDRTQQEAASVAFLRGATPPCPVAQIPNEAIPLLRAEYGFAEPAAFRGFVPYIMAPEFYWSAGSYWAERAEGLSALPQVFTDAEVPQLQDLGFCAVLYDKQLGQRAREFGTDIEGREVTWSLEPSFEDDFYAVYLID